MIGARRTLLSVFVSVVLVATAVASVWLMASAGVFTGAEQALPGAPGSGTDTTVQAGSGGPIGINSGIQVVQPRDPFEPLIVSTGGEGGEGGGETTTTVAGGETTTTVAGGETTTTTTTVAETTTTTSGDNPTGIRVSLIEVRDESGTLVAVVEVDGETYTVGVGDTFAGNFKVISLTDNSGVFTFGDSAFTLSVGQSILK